MKAQAKVHTGYEATGRLDALGLREDQLHDAVEWAYRNHVAEVTEDEPPNSLGMTMYLKLTGRVRSVLKVLGWERDNGRNLCRTVHPAGIMSIVVAGGDHNTGREGERIPSPCTVSPKGKAAGDIVNSERLFDITEYPITIKRANGANLYYLLVYVDRELREVRSELSLAYAVGPRGFVNEWAERIMLRTIPFGDADAVGADLPPIPEIDIDVRRRSAEG